MENRSSAAIIAELRSRKLRQIAELQQEIRMLDDMAKKFERPVLDFNKIDTSVRWDGGKMKFQRPFPTLFKILKALYEAYEAGEDGLSHAEIAEKVFEEDDADVYMFCYRLGQRLDEAQCPLRLEGDSHSYRLVVR